MANARDARNPEWLGRKLLQYKEHNPDMTLSQLYDSNRSKMDSGPEIDPGESTCTQTQRQYRDDLIEQAKHGDENAYQRLREIDPAIARTLAFTYKAVHTNHRAPDAIERDVETLTQTSGLDRNGDATQDDPDPGDADNPRSPPRCLDSYEAMGGGLYRCILRFGHLGQHDAGIIKW